MCVIREFILNATEKFFCTPIHEINRKNEDALLDFINNSQTFVLQTFIDSDQSLLLSTKIQAGVKKSIIFYKTSAQDLTSHDSLNGINMITLTTDAAESLYQILRQIYNPLLVIGEDLYSHKLQKNLSDLEAHLRVLTHSKRQENVKVIFSIQDEVDYWKTMAEKRDANKKEREAASSFCVLFEDICEEIRSLEASQMQEVKDSAENIAGILDDVWRYTALPYSADRMIHIFDIVGHVICSITQKTITQMDPWKIYDGFKDNEVLVLLAEGLSVVQTWISACKSLTDTYWPNYALHPWKGETYIPNFCINFETRLKEVNNIRSTYNQLVKLLTENEKAELNSQQFLEPFQNINVWIYNGPNPMWDSAVASFSAKIRPAEMKITEKLKPRMNNTSTKQMLYEFIRYKTLITRPLVKHTLSNELDIFVNSLLAMLKAIQKQLESDEVDVQMSQPAEMSPLVQRVQWAKLMEAKVKEIEICIKNYLGEFENSAAALKVASKLLTDLKTMYTQLHEDWCRDIQAQVREASSGEGPVVRFSRSERLMEVRFEPRLLRAESEARALSALALAPPPGLAAALAALTAPLAHARALHQVASFHNTLGERMIPSTRPLMLTAALELSALVQEQQPLYWSDAERLADYTERLKRVVLKLEAQNTYLTGQHLSIRNIVERLMDTDLLAKQNEWKKGIKDIRDIIEKVEANGYKSTEMWRSHWDLQLYKALEFQYVKTLLALHKHFPKVRVDMVLRDRRVRLQPPVEEIRVQHYGQLRRLVALPNHFVGLRTNIADEKSIFASIVDKHGWLGNRAVRSLEAALAGAGRACARWARRGALAAVQDLDALCAAHCSSVLHWEDNFKACKALGQAVAKMNFEDEKVEWITIGTVTLRREFEAQSRNLWASLMSSLQASCRADAAALDTFMANAIVTLEDKVLPRNSKELAEISSKQQALQEKMPEMEKTVEDLKRKGYLLRTWGGDSSFDNTIREWDKLREQILSHREMFEHQAEMVKSSLKGSWENLDAEIEAWLSRARFEPTPGSSRDDMLQRAAAALAAAAHAGRLVEQRHDLQAECEKFNMKLDISDTWKEAEKVKDDLISNWTILKDYNDEFEELAGQEWIIFQKKLHLLDDFVSKWNGLLEPYTTITLFIKQDLENYFELTTALKYLRGTDFTDSHWREVFSLLEMEYVKPETLIVKDLLKVAQNIKKHMKELQKMSASASSEASVRSALNELELWFAGARLALAPRPGLRLASNYRELIAKVEEQQWVVSAAGAAGAAWEVRLEAARRLLRAAHHAQRRWLYLEPILSNDDGELGVKFRKVDQGFRQVARIIESDPRLSALLQSTRPQTMLDTISEQLNACQSALNDYIDEKRSTFPRLYFLSDDDLLELLGQARAGAEGRETVMQSHLKKLFPGIVGVLLGPGGLSITSLCSHYGETFQLEHPVDIDCSVEVWLKNLEQEIRSSLKKMALKCLVANNMQDQDPFSLPTQILCLGQNIRFTEETEKAIVSKELHKLRDNIERENVYYAGAETENECEKYKKQALILQCAYYVSVVQSLIENNVVTTSDWFWQKQLRFYVQNGTEIVAKMGLAQISYSYEYLGVNTGQFVRTETTDESFLILTQSLHLGLVGNPFGPAGTGKTESVKALGSLFGRLVLVFNCDEAMDAQCLGRLLTGVARCGAWGCFDEFNRLPAAALAAAAHQLTALLHRADGASSNERTALLNGKRVSVSAWCGVAATMNPAARGYGGRRALPPALQHALRPLALRPPPRAALAARLLAAHAAHPLLRPDALADDLDAVFTLASTLLSAQRHYDWGLRALKAAVGSCGAALRALAPGAQAQQARAVLRAVLRLNNLSKLTRHDAVCFENILAMVFADVPEKEPPTDPVYLSLESTVKRLGLMHNQFQIQKCMELYEQLQQRMGVAIVGPPASGKTTIRQILKTALTQQGKTVVEHVICPKAMSRRELLGYVEHDTRQWTDGVLSAVALDVSHQPDDVWSWVVCDGDIDPEWVEALNSVLDDNRLLTLPSGWRVTFGPHVNFIFETHSLDHASPATISRMGIILFSVENNCSQDVLESWAEKKEFDNDTATSAVPLLTETVKRCLKWLTAHRSDVTVKECDMSLVKQIIAQFEYIAQELTSTTGSTSAEEMVWSAVQLSVMGLIKENAVESFYGELEIPSMRGVDLTGETGAGKWSDALLRSERVRACEPALRAAIRDHHAIIIGPEASAKTLLAEYVLKETNSTVITIDCTPHLEPNDVIAELRRASAARGARATLLVRALHRAAPDAWGCAPLHCFLLQLASGGGWWARGEGGPQWQAARVRLLCTAAHAPRAPRLAAALYPVLLPEADDDELLELLESYLSENTKNISEADISNLSLNMLALYKEVTETFTSKPHYKWNPSHLRQWCENIKWFSPSDLSQVVMAVNAVAAMIFGNRLVTDDEKSQYNGMAQNCFKTSDGVYFKPKMRSDGVYLDAVDYKDWHDNTQKLINQCLIDDENCFGETGVEVCRELSVLCPVIALALNGGAATCVARAGAGRRAAARLLAAAAPAQLLLLDRPAHFHTAFKNALTSASEGTRTVAVVSEAAATGVALACVEAVLGARSPHALPPAVAPPPATQQPDLAFTNMKQNLGIVICLDVEQENLSELLDSYPLLYNSSLLCWLDHWSDATLAETPALLAQRLTKENYLQMSEEDVKCIPVQEFVDIYKSLDRDRERAPSRYVHFIKTFYKIFNTKKRTLLQRNNTLSAGVEALRRARSEVARLQAEAAEQEIELSEKQTKANQALEQIGATVRANTDKKDEMHQLKKNIEMENEKLQIRKKEIEEELASVEPVIAAARAAVGDIKPESLSEVRSLRAPPDVVRDVLEGVLRLMGIADTSWHSMKSFLSKRGVKEDIRCLDAAQIGAEAAQSVARLLQRRGASFEPAAARRASAACAPLAAWVRANLDYATALARVKPLQEQQRHLLSNLKRAEAEVAALEGGLATVDERVAALQVQLGQHTRDAAALELRLANATRTLTAAQALLDRLADEDTSWEADLQNISQEILELNQRSLLAAGYLTFLSDLTEPQAREYLSRWRSLINFEDTSFSVINFLSTPEKQLKWEADGLPLDQSAFKNAIFIEQYLERVSPLTPLLLDPEGEAEAWLRAALASAPADVVPHHAPRLATAIQCALRMGRTLVITEVESIEDWWWSALSTSNGRGRVLLVVRRDAFTAPPHVRASLAPLHFAARLHALVDQLVNYAMQNQNPEMTEKLKEIKLTKATLQKQRHELQENLLRDLSGKADILHDEGLLVTLESTRSSGVTIAKALSAARELEQTARDACVAFDPSACRAAALALATRRVAALPADTLLEEFAAAVTRVSPSNSNQINEDDVIKHFTRRIIERVLLGLHKKDKYIVVMYLLRQVYDSLIPEKLWQIVIGNINIIEDTSVVNEIRKRFQWIADAYIGKVAQIKVQDENLFKKLSLDNSEMWTEFQKSGDLHLVSKLNLEPFEIIVAVAALRPASLYRAIVAFVDRALGAGALGGGRAAERAARWAGAQRPVLLLAAHAHDALAALAQSQARTLHTVSEQEGPAAWHSALEHTRGGSWLALTVGASAFTRDLLSFVASLSERPASDFDDEFRLWILAEDREIPSALANSCVPVVLESPEGVKRNACGILSAWTGAREAAPLARFLVGLALFHALAQERRAYIPQGWSRWYEWEWGDVSAGGALAREASGAAARELCGALYAARVDRGADRALLHALLARALREPAPAPLPASEHVQDYITALEALPDIDTPELLELPANCRAAWETNAANNILAGLRELNSTANTDTVDATTPVKTFLSLWKRMMSGCPLIKADYNIEKSPRGWWGALCGAELRDAAAAARALHVALARLAHEPQTRLNVVPDEWQLLWPGPDAPEAYIKEFCHRARAAVARVNAPEFSEDYMPKEVDLREFLCAGRVLCALRARAAGRRACALRTLALAAQWDCSAAEVTDGAVLVRGLRLSGGEWVANGAGRGGAVRAARGDAPPHAPAPPLLLRCVPQTDAAGESACEIPLYASEAREQRLACVRAPLHASFAPQRALLHALALFVAPHDH